VYVQQYRDHSILRTKCFELNHQAGHAAFAYQGGKFVVQIKSVVKRTYQLSPTGLEVFFSGRSSLYLTFRTMQEREQYPPPPPLLNPRCWVDDSKARCITNSEGGIAPEAGSQGSVDNAAALIQSMI